MKKYLPFVFYWLANSVIILLVNSFFPNNVVIGNAWISGIWAMLWIGFLLTLLCRAAKQLLATSNLKKSSRVKKFIVYLVANSVIIWLLTRIPSMSAIGISKFYWAIILGLLLNTFQWLTRQGLKKMKAI